MIDEHQRPEAQPGETTAEERELWTGKPSQWTNFPWFLSCLLVIPIPFALYKMMRVASTRYTLTTERLIWRFGILNRRTEEVELYRVRDTGLSQPLFQRLVGLGTIEVTSTDERTPDILLPAIKDPVTVREYFREATERMRQARGVRDIDMT
jgi:uncharacterized membrane protein YdbT with pleckstrin-like domain